MAPLEPGNIAIGTNTATRTSVLAMIGPQTWPIALRVASEAESLSSFMMRATFSATTMASSFSTPIATTMPNSDNRLMDAPNMKRPAQVPTSAIGTISVGISVLLQLCRNRNTMAVTSSSASTMVTSTELMEVVMKGVVSNGTVQPTPAGNTDSSSVMRCLTCRATSSALASLAS
ncbi:hypothetical protein D3C72_1349170 [compost metagenome]